MGLYIAPIPTLCWLLAAARWSGGTKASRKNPVRVRGSYANIVEDTFCQYEEQIVDLITTHNVERVFFTGHSLGGGLANVAHLVVRGQLALGKAKLLGSGSPWTHPKLDEVAWLACTFAAPETIVRPPEATQLIKDLDNWSYNIVDGCDAVPRGLMLTYLGDLLKNVVLPDNGPKTEDVEVLNTLPLFGTLLNTIGENKINDGDVPTRDDNVTKTYKGSGLTTVMRQFTHTGTVVYKPPFSSCQYLKGNDINGTLDQAWGWNTKLPTKFLPPGLARKYNLALLDVAHAYYEKFEFDK